MKLSGVLIRKLCNCMASMALFIGVATSLGACRIIFGQPKIPEDLLNRVHKHNRV